MQGSLGSTRNWDFQENGFAMRGLGLFVNHDAIISPNTAYGQFKGHVAVYGKPVGSLHIMDIEYAR